MAAFPEDIFTEPTNIDPDTLANLGPLTRLAGVWQGDKSLDINPKADGPEHRVFHEHIELQPIDPQTNGPQLFYGLRYHIHITADGEEFAFHDQVGYWLWEPATGLILQTVTIPRGQAIMAGGKAKPGDKTLHLEATRGSTEDGISECGFLEYAFRTDSYTIDVTFNDDGTWSYQLTTMLTVKGEAAPFKHQDRNTLHKLAEPTPNDAMARKVAGSKPKPQP